MPVASPLVRKGFKGHIQAGMFLFLFSHHFVPTQTLDKSFIHLDAHTMQALAAMWSSVSELLPHTASGASCAHLPKLTSMARNTPCWKGCQHCPQCHQWTEPCNCVPGPSTTLETFLQQPSLCQARSQGLNNEENKSSTVRG